MGRSSRRQTADGKRQTWLAYFEINTDLALRAFFLPSAFCLLPSAFCLLPSAFTNVVYTVIKILQAKCNRYRQRLHKLMLTSNSNNLVQVLNLEANIFFND